MIITIDGPVASGKSSVAKALSKALGCCYLNTGLLYRAAAYLLMTQEKFKEITDKNIALLTVADLACLARLSYTYEHNELHVHCDGKDITSVLVEKKYDQPASMISSQPIVREALLDVQRAVAQRFTIVADGRDCGTVVFPHADVKFFLTASIDIRAQRLLNDPTRKTSGATIDEIKASVIERDERDKNRVTAPLRVPENAIMVDNSTMSFEATVEKMLRDIRKKIPN